MPANADLTAELAVLSALPSRGYVRGQVPEMLFVPPDMEDAEQQVQDHAAAISRLIDKGMVGWKCDKKPGRPAALHTHRPINPATGREITAYLWMTTLALDTHGDALYEAYSQACAGNALARNEWNDQMRREVIEAPPHMAHLTSPPLPPKKNTTPKADPTPNAQGVATRLGSRHTATLFDNSLRGADYLALLDKWNVGPSTLLTIRGGETQSPGWLAQSVLERAGKAGVAWLSKHGTPLEPVHYAYALFHRDETGQQTGVVDAWNALQVAGVDPRGVDAQGNTLWHHLRNDWRPELVGWLKEHGVDWARPNNDGVLPLALLLECCMREQGTRDFFENDALFGGASLLSMMSMMGMGFPGSTTDQDLTQEDPLASEKAQIAFMEDLALEMIRSGVPVTHKDKNGMTALDSIHPEQIHLEKAIAEQVGPSEDLPQTITGTMMFGEMAHLRRFKKAYSPRMVEFIERIEQACGCSLLSDAPIPVRRPRP